jgi:hypothetical protein
MKNPMHRLIPGLLIAAAGACAAIAGPASLRPMMSDAVGPAVYTHGEQPEVVRTRFVNIALDDIRPVDERSAPGHGVDGPPRGAG